MKGFLLRTIGLVLLVLLTHVSNIQAQETVVHSVQTNVATSATDSTVTIAPEPIAQPKPDQKSQKAPVSNAVTFATKEVLLNWLNLLFVTGMMLVILGLVAIHRASKNQVNQ